MVVEYYEVLADATGGDGKEASLVRGDFTSQFNCLKKTWQGRTGGSCWLGRTIGYGVIEGLVDRMFFRSCLRCPFTVDSNLGRCFCTSLEVRPGQVAKYPASMDFIQV